MKILNNYTDFILESKLELLLESDIFFSDKFVNFLKDINSPLSSQLLSLRGRKIDANIGYVDVELTKDDTAVFTPGSKETKYKVVDTKEFYKNTSRALLGYEKVQMWNNGEMCIPAIGDIGTIEKLFTIEEVRKCGTLGGEEEIYRYKGGMVEFKWHSNNLKPGITEYYASATGHSFLPELDLTKKSEIKIGRLIKKILNTEGISTPSDKEVEDFVNKYKTIVQVTNNALLRFKVVKGEDIRKYYLSDNYNNIKGTLGGSCMRTENCQPFFDIYVSNPEKVSLLILMNKDGSDKICGRAIIWTDNKGRTIMDRIYTNDSADEELFKEYAIKNKYLYKLKQSYSDDSLMFNNARVTEEENIVVIDLPERQYDYYPYMDTMKYYNPTTGILSNRKNNPLYFLEKTDGRYYTV